MNGGRRTERGGGCCSSMQSGWCGGTCRQYVRVVTEYISTWAPTPLSFPNQRRNAFFGLTVHLSKINRHLRLRLILGNLHLFLGPPPAAMFSAVDISQLSQLFFFLVPLLQTEEEEEANKYLLFGAHKKNTSLFDCRVCLSLSPGHVRRESSEKYLTNGSGPLFPGIPKLK